MDSLLDLANDIERLSRERSRGPWKADVKANIGENWMIAFLGQDADCRADHIVTTDHVHASEATSRPEIDAQIIPLLVNNARAIVDALRFQAAARGEAA
jgi:hypothetical protein